MTNFNERLDKILINLANNLKPLEVGGERIYITEIGEERFTTEAKQAILRWVADEIVPRHEHNNWCFIHCQFGDKSANKFIEEKREILAQHGYKGEDDE